MAASQLFPQFGKLPLELQQAVWRFAARESPAAPVCIFETNTERLPLSALRVDLEMHPLMSTCREARAAAIAHFQYQERQTACLGMHRDARMGRKVLYIPGHHYADFFTSQQGLGLHHIALDEAVLSEAWLEGLAALLGRMKRLRTLSVIFLQDPRFAPGELVHTQLYRLAECAQDDTVWASRPGRIRRERVDPREITSWVRNKLALCSRDEDLKFDVVPLKMVPQSRLGLFKRALMMSPLFRFLGYYTVWRVFLRRFLMS